MLHCRLDIGRRSFGTVEHLCHGKSLANISPVTFEQVSAVANCCKSLRSLQTQKIQHAVHSNGVQSCLHKARTTLRNQILATRKAIYQFGVRESVIAIENPPVLRGSRLRLHTQGYQPLINY